VSTPTTIPSEAEYDRTREHLARVRERAVHLDPAECTAIDRALELAIACHHDARPRPDGAPYLEHVLCVADRVVEWVGTPSADLIAAALLHDTVEDAPGRLAAMQSGEGTLRERAVAMLASAVSRRAAQWVGALTNPDWKHDLPRRLGVHKGTAIYDAILCAEYTTHFVGIFARGDEVGLIKLADFSDNALSLQGVEGDPRRFAWLVRKYGPCVAFLRDHLRTLAAADPLAPTRELHLQRVEAAWERWYAPGAAV
jgi:(p)ppGpp synthase/HD superfamily hydrolase